MFYVYFSLMLVGLPSLFGMEFQKKYEADARESFYQELLQKNLIDVQTKYSCSKNESTPQKNEFEYKSKIYGQNGANVFKKIGKFTRNAVPSYSWRHEELCNYQFCILMGLFIIPPQVFYQALKNTPLIVPPVGWIGVGLGCLGSILDYSPLKIAGGLILGPPLTGVGIAEVIKQINRVI